MKKDITMRSRGVYYRLFLLKNKYADEKVAVMRGNPATPARVSKCGGFFHGKQAGGIASAATRESNRVGNASIGFYTRNIAAKSTRDFSDGGSLTCFAMDGRSESPTQNMPFYPVVTDEFIIGVGASDTADKKELFSNYRAAIELMTRAQGVSGTLQGQVFS